MRIEQYERVVRSTDRTSVEDGQMMRIFGLAGEIGSLLSELKKNIREGNALPGTPDRVSEEIGDILWYITAMARHAGHRLREDVLCGNLRKIRRRAGSGRALAPSKERAGKTDRGFAAAVSEVKLRKVRTFDDYQKLALKTSRYRHPALLPFIARVWSHSVQLLEGAHNETSGPDVRYDSKLIGSLGDVAWYIANIAHSYDLTLDGIAAKNSEKVTSRWPGQRPKHTALFDKKAPRLEKFPRRFSVHIAPKNERTAVMILNEVLIGDPLTDNAWEPDGYRFHDVMHLAHAGVLGWSPVLRRMLNRKRKYNKRIDEVEDGARAAIVEEAIAKLVHAYAQSVDPEKLLDDQRSVSFDILKRIKSLTVGLEVEKCQYWEWEKAMLTGQKVFNRLRRKGKGVIEVDLVERTIRLH